MKIYKAIKKTCTLIFWAAFVLFIIAMAVVAVIATVQRIQGLPHPVIFGSSWAFVVSGSMEPTIPTGSFILIEEKENYEVGDIITYLDSSNTSITHRLVEISGDTFITQGDAVGVADAPIHKSQVIGCVQDCPNNAEYVISLTIFSIALFAMFWMFIFVPLLEKTKNGQ